MGCDIHYTIEEKHNDKWVGVYCSDFVKYDKRMPAANRFYSFFAALAGVRAEDGDNIRKPQGLPEDLSDLSKVMVGYEDDDGGNREVKAFAENLIPILSGYCDLDLHSHSYMSVKEFCDIYRETQKHLGSEVKIGDYEIVGGFPDTARIIFCFDN